MFQNYLKIALRNLWKQKAFSFVNIIGLAVSMSVCLLIMLIIADQKSYDQFHTKKDRIYRVLTIHEGKNPSASSALPLAERLKREYAGIERTAGLVRKIGGDIFYKEKNVSVGGYFTDAELFKIFDFKLSKGDVNTALKNPFSLVISEDVATQLFGNQDPMGKAVKFNDKGINPDGTQSGANREVEYGTFTITGILKPTEGKTHLPFKLLASLSTLPTLSNNKVIDFTENDWNNVWNSYTYVLLNKNKTKADLQNDLNQIAKKQYITKENKYKFEAQALTDIPLSDAIGNMTYIAIPKIMLYILGILCLIVMLSACLNYTNLSVARALTRAKEVGVRKVLGATRSQIFGQFITEAIIISLCSLVLAIGILSLLEIALTGLILNKNFKISFQENISLYAEFIGFSLVVGFIAGLLPSIYISAFNPIQMLKNFSSVKLFKRLTLQKMLLVTQFCVSLIFIISTTLLYFQTNYIFNFDYGFQKNNIINIKLYKPENFQRFAQSVASNKDVVGISACAYMPVAGNTNNSTTAFKVDTQKDSIQVNYLDIDAKCVDVWGLKLLAGKNLPEIPSISNEQSVLINEAMVKNFHYPSNAAAVGQQLLIDGNNVKIVGVVKNFNFRDETRKIGELVLRNRQSQFETASIKISGKKTPEVLAFLAKQWKSVNPNTKFEYEFLDQQLLFIHTMLHDAVNVLSFLAFLSVLISCMGLLGMATYTAETRTKEIGIRKVLGATIPQIAILLSRGFIFLLLIAIVIAIPLAYFVNNLWLNFFANRISLSPKIFLIGISMMLGISLLIVFSQTIRAALTNPVKSLKME